MDRTPKRLRKAQKHQIRAFRIGEGMPDPNDLSGELHDMLQVLMGRAEPPIDVGVMTMMEVASAYHARALEIQMLLHEGEREGRIAKGGALYKFRTGELRDFIEIAKYASELGSRRLSAETLLFDQARYGRDM
jgi:hypothetical protein